MTSLWRAAAAAGLLGIAALAACSGGTSVTPGDGHARTGTNIARALPLQSPSPSPTPLAGSVTCALLGGSTCQVLKNGALLPNPNANAVSIVGFTPADLRNAYAVPAARASGKLIAIVDAYDDPSAESDLAVYRTRFGLPPCTSANGCFKKYQQSAGGLVGVVSQLVGNLLPGVLGSSKSANWGDEIALDLAMASAACPSCSIALIEAQDSSVGSLSASVKAAAGLHPATISNSYGVVESTMAVVPPGAAPPSGKQSVSTDQVAAYAQPGIAVVASAGDGGVTSFPASLPSVIAVGGTSLSRNPAVARGWSEQVWSASGQGCSTLFAAPAWQSAALTGCTTRAVADIAFSADLNPGIAVYSSASGGWVVLGGTSAGAPFVAGLIAAAADYGGTASGANGIWTNRAAFNRVSSSSTRFATLGSPNGLAGL